MQFIVSFEFVYRYWKQLHTKHENLFSISLNQSRNYGLNYGLHYVGQLFDNNGEIRDGKLSS